MTPRDLLGVAVTKVPQSQVLTTYSSLENPEELGTGLQSLSPGVTLGMSSRKVLRDEGLGQMVSAVGPQSIAYVTKF
jgi:hypothetical protein